MSTVFNELRTRLTAEAVVRALGLKRSDAAWRCPSCRGRFELCDDITFGLSVRCLSPRCKLAAWAWPEHPLANLRGIDLDVAERLLLAAGREHDERRRRESPHEQSRRRLAARLA